MRFLTRMRDMGILFAFPSGTGSHAERSEAWFGKAHGSRTALTVATSSGISRAKPTQETLPTWGHVAQT